MNLGPGDLHLREGALMRLFSGVTEGRNDTCRWDENSRSQCETGRLVGEPSEAPSDDRVRCGLEQKFWKEQVGARGGEAWVPCVNVSPCVDR